jgi:hypothetical protein
MTLTAGYLPMTWDEGDAIARSQSIEHWFDRWVSPEVGAERQENPLSQEAIRQDWPFLTRREGHPAGYALLIAAGKNFAETIYLSRFLPPLTKYRFGGLMLASLAIGMVFYRMRKQFSLAAAVAGVLSLFLIPRLFAHLHIAACDGPLIAAWLLAWATFEPARRKNGWAILWGVCLASAMSMKFTGWLVPIPFFLWSILHLFQSARTRPQRRPVSTTATGEENADHAPSWKEEALALLRTWAIGLAVALTVFYVLNPPMWHSPIDSLRQFFAANLHRDDYNIAILFLGRMYNLHHSLPWYNTLLWTAITVPVGLLVLLLIGIATGLRRSATRSATLLLLLNGGLLLVVRALPGTPPHDGIRLFAPAFAFLALLAGVGVDGCFRYGMPPKKPETPPPPFSRRFLSRRAGSFLAICLLSGSATSLFWYAPHWLSYYNLLIGGLPGAVQAGMEPTYYWDGLDRETLQWLHEHTGADEGVCFEAAPPKNLDLLAEWGRLDVPYYPTRKDRRFRFEPSEQKEGTEQKRSKGGEDSATAIPFRWYVLQRRPSAMFPADRWLVEHREPAFRHLLRRGGWGPWRLDVPLVEVYSFADYHQAWRATHPETDDRQHRPSGTSGEPSQKNPPASKSSRGKNRDGTETRTRSGIN